MEGFKGKRPRAAKSTRVEFTCKEAVGAMGDFFSATLSIQRRLDFEEHLKGCAECTAFLRTYEKTIEGMRNTVKSHLPSTPVLKLRKPPQDYRPVKLVDYLLN